MKKKTIAILLVLVIGMVGVFAEGGDTQGEPGSTKPGNAAATLTLTTSVDQILQTKLLDAALVDSNSDPNLTRSAFTSATNSLSTKGVARGTNANIGYLYVMTNYTGGYDLTISGESLKSTDAAGTPILYTLSAGAAVLDLVGNTSAGVSVASIGGLTVTEYAVSVTVDGTSYDLANAATDYTTDVTFTFKAK